MDDAETALCEPQRQSMGQFPTAGRNDHTEQTTSQHTANNRPASNICLLLRLDKGKNDYLCIKGFNFCWVN